MWFRYFDYGKLHYSQVKNLKNIFVSTTFAKNDSKISEVLLACKKANISNIDIEREEGDINVSTDFRIENIREANKLPTSKI